MTNTRNRNVFIVIYNYALFERVANNIVVSLHRTQHKNQYIQTVVYYFTKHIKAYALPGQT